MNSFEPRLSVRALLAFRRKILSALRVSPFDLDFAILIRPCPQPRGLEELREQLPIGLCHRQ